MRTSPTALVMSLLSISIASTAMLSQVQKPSFEVASIKPSRGGNGGIGGCHGVDSKIRTTDMRANVPLGRCGIRAARLSQLISIAFDSSIYRIEGAPEWDEDRFDIDAKADDVTNTTEQQLLLMLQQFVTEQFKLTYHRETREVPTYNLVIVRNGPKNLRASSEDSGQTALPNGASVAFTGYSMNSLAGFLSTMPSVARPVKNLTSLDGRFDFKLDVLESSPADIADFKRDLSRWDTVFSDLQQQLGLRLDGSKGSIEILVIDHAEKPAKN